MIMVVIGAGASYDSSPDFDIGNAKYANDRLPLANQLFENRPMFSEILEKFKQCYPILTYLRPNPDVSVEQELQRLSDEASEKPERYQELAAISYYL